MVWLLDDEKQTNENMEHVWSMNSPHGMRSFRRWNITLGIRPHPYGARIAMSIARIFFVLGYPRNHILHNSRSRCSSTPYTPQLVVPAEVLMCGVHRMCVEVWQCGGVRRAPAICLAASYRRLDVHSLRMLRACRYSSRRNNCSTMNRATSSKDGSLLV